MGKKYDNAKKIIDSKKNYSIIEAVKLLQEVSFTRFDASIDLAIKMNLDTTRAEQQFRGSISLPHYFGKNIKMLVIDDTLTNEKAKALNVEYFGGAEKIAEIKDGWIDFDVIITTPKFMPELSKLGKILGPKGLMPNPKLGTVTVNVIKSIEDIKKGKYNYKTDTYGNIHLSIGKISSPADAVAENIKFFINFLNSKKPSTVKGELIQKITISSSMSPAIKIIKY